MFKGRMETEHLQNAIEEIKAALDCFYSGNDEKGYQHTHRAQMLLELFSVQEKLTKEGLLP